MPPARLPGQLPSPAPPHTCCALRPRRARRNAFGNNPDTSKALRFLVAEARIVRGGAGGRKDPYSYVVRGAALLGGLGWAGQAVRASPMSEGEEQCRCGWRPYSRVVRCSCRLSCSAQS